MPKMATSSKNKTFVNKDDLKRLMKQKKNNLQTNKKRIESPLAKYDSVDQLHCALCGCKVKTDLLWNAHISGRTHKENLAHLKEQQKRKADERLQPPITTDVKRRKTQVEVQRVPPTSTSRAGEVKHQSSLPSDFFDNDGPTPGPSSGVNVLGYEDPEGSDSESTTPAGNRAAQTTGQKETQVTGLPADFFDAGIPPSEAAADTEVAETSSSSKSMAEKLPEGFFDDAKQDAKARQVEYKDKMEEEWDMFQKAMKEETQVSEALQEEDNDTVQVERNIKEIDEQMYHWSKVEELHQKKQKVMTTKEKISKDTGQSSDSEIDEQEFEEFLDWRSKKVN